MTRRYGLIGVLVVLAAAGCSPSDRLSVLQFSNASTTRDEDIEDFSVDRLSTPEGGCTTLHGLEAFLDDERLPTDAGGEVCTTPIGYFDAFVRSTPTCTCAQPFITFDPEQTELHEGPIVNTIELRLGGEIATIELQDLTRRRHTVPSIAPGRDGSIHLRPGQTLTFVPDEGADGELWLTSDIWLTETADRTGFTVEADAPPRFRVSTVLTSSYPVRRCDGMGRCYDPITRHYTDDYTIEVDAGR